MKRRGVFLIAGTVAVLAMLAAAFVIMAPQASHATASTLYVSSTGTSSNAGASCSSARYDSIQAAVDAAAGGDTVYLCGTAAYGQQVVIGNKSLTLTGDSGATIAAPSAWLPTTDTHLPSILASNNLRTPHAIVLVWGTGTVNVTGLTLQGPTESNGNCWDEDFGVLTILGASSHLTYDNVLDIRDTPLNGCQGGRAVEFGAYNWYPVSGSRVNTSTTGSDFSASGSLDHVAVSDYQKAGIEIEGAHSSATISLSVITGVGPTAAIAQNGIEVLYGATATIAHSDISGNAYTGSDVAGGILVYSGGANAVTVTDSYLHDNQSSLLMDNSAAPVANSLVASSNCVLNNIDNGAEDDTSPSTAGGIKAEQNWWGAASGPSDASNPGGTGQVIDGPVDYTHWLTSPAPICQGPVISHLAISLNGPNMNISATASNAATTAFASIVSAEYTYDGGAFSPMSASDGHFSSVTEAIQATKSPYALGDHKVCVRATDAAGFIGATTCESFTITSTGLSGNGTASSPVTAQSPNVPLTPGNTTQANGAGSSSNASGSKAGVVTTPSSSSAPIALIVALIVVFFAVLGGGAVAIMRRRTN